MEATSRHVRGADGNGIHVLEWSTEGVPLLLLHGFGNEAHIWDDFAPAVAPYYRTIAMDHRGHGDSDWDSEQRYGYEAMVRDVESVQGFQIQTDSTALRARAPMAAAR